MSEWELAQALNEAAGDNNQVEVSRLIAESDFTDKPFALQMALNSFVLTPENVQRNKESALRLAGLPLPPAANLTHRVRRSTLCILLERELRSGSD